MKKEIADIQIVKKGNMKLVLSLIRNNKAVSRAEIAKITGLTRATVSSLVDELIEKGLVEEIGAGESSGGRKPIMLKLRLDSYFVVGIDLSNERVIKGYLCNMEAKAISFREQEYNNNLSSIYETIKELIEQLINLLPASGKIAGIGIGAAGLVNPEKREVLFSANFDIEGTKLVYDLSKQFGIPVFIENESNAAAWAEMEYGNGKGFRNILYVSMGKGIGSGIIINGSIYYGGFFGAGEVGHIMVDPFGGQCRCGAVGCLEVYASFSKISDQVIKAKNSELSIGDIAEAYLKGDTMIKEIIDREAAYLAKAVAISSNLLNVEAIILGGYIIPFGAGYIEQVKKVFNEHVIKYYRDKVHITSGKLGGDAVGIGGAALVLKRIWEIEII